jgi:hypothetical protein
MALWTLMRSSRSIMAGPLLSLERQQRANHVVQRAAASVGSIVAAALALL